MQSSPRGRSVTLQTTLQHKSFLASKLCSLDRAMSSLVRAWIYSPNKCPITVGFVHMHFRRRVGLLVWLIYFPPLFFKNHNVYPPNSVAGHPGDTCGLPFATSSSFPKADNLAKFKQVFMSIVNARKFWCRLFKIFPFQSFTALFQDMRMVLQVSACLTEMTGTSQWVVFQWVCWLPLGFLFVFESEMNSLSWEMFCWMSNIWKMYFKKEKMRVLIKGSLGLSY